MSGSLRILRRNEVCHRVGCSASTIDRMEANGEFPRRVQLSPYTVGWAEGEIAEWLKERLDARDASARIGAGRASKRRPAERHASQ